MNFDTGSLQFYLEHAEETRTEREKFFMGEDVNLDVIPRHIYNSWIRSTALGVNPHISDTPIARNSEQFSTAFQLPYRELKFFFSCFHFMVAFFDQNGKIISDISPEHETYAGEKYIGTTSVGIVLAEKRPATCFGYQNFKLPFCKQFCLSSPVFNDQKDPVGVVTVMLPPPQPTQAQYEQGIAFIELMEVMFRIGYRNRDTDSDTLELFMQMLPDFSDGVILFNRNKSAAKYNQAAIRLLGFQGFPGEKPLAEKLDILCSADEAGKKNKSKEPIGISRKVNSKMIFYLLKAPEHSGPPVRQFPISVAKHTFRDLLGEDPNFLRAKNEAFIVASNEATVLIQGETGVGKELFAQSIHNASQRKNMPFVAINCGTVQKDLFASELFGYEAGAFTGASTQGKIGVLEAASGGTLFLDEIESMPLSIQAGLLRCISSGFIRRVGGISDIPVNLRIVAATKIDLLYEAKYTAEWKVKFRADLYYRLSTCKIYVPALRERRRDIPILANHFIEQKKQELGYPNIRATESFMETLHYYDWKGNIRELENVIERAVIFMDAEAQQLTRALLYPELLEDSDRNRLEFLRNEKSHTENADSALKAEEMLTIQRYLLQCNYNVKDAAIGLGISRQTLYRKIRLSPALIKMVGEEKKRKRSKK
ncbi:MAG: sigma 54-interacting transcriptional regulator [Clostridiales bacterium]|jgi:transcriptional regulator with PAS, ATPase and Fis domain|nr:sigma 54-interacting transcriptional regulator [Clostridiales bacterium]